MRTTKGLLSTFVAGSAGLLLASASYAQTPAPAAPVAPAAAAATAAGSAASADTDAVSNIIKGNVDKGMNWFGGPIYTGAPALEATAALVAAGGGAADFSFAKALTSMLGEDIVKAEVAKLVTQYGEADVNNFISGMDFAVKDGLKRATEAGVKLPKAPKGLVGINLAKALVQAGTVDGTFWAGYLFDKALSHDLHNTVMADIESDVDSRTDLNVHKILNQAMYNVAQTLGMDGVGLAPLH